MQYVQCHLFSGYTGMRCQDEINECASVTCPGNGQCFDAVNKYYCRCPLKYTGTNCAKGNLELLNCHLGF